MNPVRQSLVNDCSPYGLPKKPSCDEAGSSTKEAQPKRLSSPLQHNINNSKFWYNTTH